MDNSPLTIDEINGTLPSNIRITNHIKSGGQGAVFKGTCDGHDSAIKVFHAGDPEIAKRIERETQFLIEAQNKNLVKVKNRIQINLRSTEFVVVVYEFIAGGDLLDNYRSSLPLDEKLVAKIGLDISNAIKCMWENSNRIVHRDIKPENIVKRGSDEFVLVDLSYARHINLSDITVFGTRGTVGYMAPEHAIGRKNLTFKADVFSLGVTLYCLSTGHHPFKNQQPIAEVSFAPIRTLNPKISTALESLIHQMLAKSPMSRPSDLIEKFSTLI